MVKLRRLPSTPIYPIVNRLPMASIGPSGAENTIGSMVQYDDQVISLRLLRRNSCKSLGLGLSLGRLIGKHSVNPWLRVVTRLSLFGCDEPSSTEPRWIVATTG